MAGTGNTAANVTVGKPSLAGAFWIAPSGTTTPTSADATLNAAFKCLGYLGEEGLKKITGKTVEEIKAWGGDVVATPQTEFSDKFSTTFIEALNIEVLKAVYGSTNVSGDLTAGITVKVNSQENANAVFVVDMIATGDVLYRMVIPDGKITEIGEVEYVDGKPIGYEATIQTYPDSSGNNHYEYIKKKAAT